MGGRSQSMRTFKEKLELGARTMQASRGRVVVAKTDGNEPEIVEDIDLQEANPRSPSSEDMHGDVDTICHQVENEPNPEKPEVDAMVRLQGEVNKTCMCCGTTKTAQWRTGPLGRKTLCNACGVRFSRARYGKGKKRTRGRKRGLAHENSCMEASEEQGECPIGSSEDRNKAAKDGDVEVVDSNQPDTVVADSTVGSMPCTPHTVDKGCLIDFQKGSEQSSKEGYFRSQAEKEDQEVMPPYGLVPPRPVVDADQTMQNQHQVLDVDSHARTRSGKSKSINALVKEALKDPSKVPVINYQQSTEPQHQEDNDVYCNANPEINIQTEVPVKIYQSGARKRLAMQNPQSSNTSAGKPVDEGAAARERYFNFLQLLRQDRHASLQSKMTSSTHEKPPETINAPVVFASGVQPCGVSSNQDPRPARVPGTQAQWTTDQSLHTAVERHPKTLDTPRHNKFEPPVPPRETLGEQVVVDGAVGRRKIIMGVSTGSVEAVDIQSALGRINELQHRVQGAEACVAAMKKVLAGAMQEVYSAHEELHTAKQSLQNLIGDIDSRASSMTFNNTTTILD